MALRAIHSRIDIAFKRLFATSLEIEWSFKITEGGLDLYFEKEENLRFFEEERCRDNHGAISM